MGLDYWVVPSNVWGQLRLYCQCPWSAGWPRVRRGVLTLAGAGWCREPPMSGTQKTRERGSIVPPSLSASRLLSTPLSLPRNSPWPQLETPWDFHHLWHRPKGEGSKHIKGIYDNLYYSYFLHHKKKNPCIHILTIFTFKERICPSARNS